MSLAPIALFVYNRPLHTRLTVEALQKNELADQSELFIYCDGAKSQDDKEKVDEVKSYVRGIGGFKRIEVIERVKNHGLAGNIIDGVTEVVNRNGKAIVLEDDLLTGVDFLEYMNKALDVYESREDIFSITGFNYPHSFLPIPESYKEDVYLGYRCMSWGWATWKDRWSKVDWSVMDFESLKSDHIRINDFNKGGKDLFYMLERQMRGEMDSWAIRFCYAHHVYNAFCVYPIQSLVSNIGFDGTGIHCPKISGEKYQNDLVGVKNKKLNPNISVNSEIAHNFYKLFE